MGHPESLIHRCPEYIKRILIEVFRKVDLVRGCGPEAPALGEWPGSAASPRPAHFLVARSRRGCTITLPTWKLAETGYRSRAPCTALFYQQVLVVSAQFIIQSGIRRH